MGGLTVYCKIHPTEKLTVLLTTAVCDVCNPPAGAAPRLTCNEIIHALVMRAERAIGTDTSGLVWGYDTEPERWLFVLTEKNFEALFLKDGAAYNSMPMTANAEHYRTLKTGLPEATWEQTEYSRTVVWGGIHTVKLPPTTAFDLTALHICIGVYP